METPLLDGAGLRTIDSPFNVAGDARQSEGMTSLHDDRPARRFEREEAGETVFADYRRDGARLIIDHVEAPPALRGTGAAGRLMAEVAAHARTEGLRIAPLCGYAGAWLARSADYRDLVDR